MYFTRRGRSISSHAFFTPFLSSCTMVYVTQCIACFYLRPHAVMEIYSTRWGRRNSSLLPPSSSVMQLDIQHNILHDVSVWTTDGSTRRGEVEQLIFPLLPPCYPVTQLQIQHKILHDVSAWTTMRG